MTQHQKAQQLANAYYDFLINWDYDPHLAWDEAMALFKLEMQK